MSQNDVIIVGAGASGLLAARELSRGGKRVLILEARDRIGGRIFPLPEDEWGYGAQGGAEFVHGRAPITRSIIETAGLTLTNPSEWWSVRDGAPKKLEGTSPSDPALTVALAKLEHDIPITEFLDINFPGEEYAFLRSYVCRWVEGYDAADPKRASTFGFRDEMSAKDDSLQQNLKEGYGALLRHLKVHCEESGVLISLNTEVRAVDLTGDTVVVRCKDDSVYQAAHVIVTVPLPMIRTIQFTPALPEKLAAVERLGFGVVIKILLRFKKKWWTGVRENIFERLFFLISNEKIPTWWTQYPEDRPVLTGWAASSKALGLKGNSDEEIRDIALRSLSNIFNIQIEELREGLVHYKIVNWPQDPYARGAYSYATPESAEAIAELSKSVGNRLYFCGEAFAAGGAIGTVEGAFESAMETVARIALQ